MTKNRETRYSEFLSLVLRHKPEAVGIKLDEAGWADVRTPLDSMTAHGRALSQHELERIVEHNDKRRFQLSEDKQRIRANQGHSVDVDLGYLAQAPPALLYHGTVARFLGSIREAGLSRGSRHHVHLSRDRSTARNVGARRGNPIILKIDAARMHADGREFFVSDNGVWLTDHVPFKYVIEESK